VPAGHVIVVVVVVSLDGKAGVVVVVVVTSRRGVGVVWTEIQPDSNGDANSTAIRFWSVNSFLIPLSLPYFWRYGSEKLPDGNSRPHYPASSLARKRSRLKFHLLEPMSIKDQPVSSPEPDCNVSQAGAGSYLSASCQPIKKEPFNDTPIERNACVTVSIRRELEQNQRFSLF